jgi:glycosyltransferase involved in cell wall biosynthesis
MKSKVSVIMTAYNRQRYIARAIESVLAQTYSEFELIVVDDGSGDDTVAIARSYEAADQRVRVVVNNRNLGDYPNRNHAASFAGGMFLKYHDSDDIMYPHCLEVMLRALESEPRAAFALSSLRYWPGSPCPVLSTPRMSFQREFLGSGMFGAAPAHALFRTEVLRELGGFPEAGVHSDFFFWLSACSRVNVLLVPADLFWYRVHPDQELQKSTSDNRAETFRKGWEALNDSSCPLTGTELIRARRNWTFLMVQEVFSLIASGQSRKVVHFWKTSGLSLRKCLTYLRRPRRNAAAGAGLESGEYVVSEHRSGVSNPTSAR